MKSYSVECKETLSATINVMAENEEEAKKKALADVRSAVWRSSGIVAEKATLAKDGQTGTNIEWAYENLGYDDACTIFGADAVNEYIDIYCVPECPTSVSKHGTYFIKNDDVARKEEKVC